MLSSRRSTTNQDAIPDATKDTMEEDTENEPGTTTFPGDPSGPDPYHLTIRDSKGVFHPLGNYTHVRTTTMTTTHHSTISCAVSLSCVLCNFVCVCVCVKCSRQRHIATRRKSVY